jgi:hypothetical protein
MRYTLTLKQSLPFAQNPRFAELEGEKILCNDVNLPKAIDPDNGYNPHNVRLWVIGHEFGAICAVFASHEQDALDSAVDGGMLDCLMAEDQNPPEDEREGLAPLGNASELFDLSHAWLAEVEFDATRDIHLIVKLVRASAEGADTL